MGLIAGDGPVPMCPGCPLVGEIGQQHIGQCLAVVAHHLCVAVYKLLQFVLQPIAPATGKLIEEGRGPVGTVHLVAVVEERVREGRAALCECLLDVLQVVRYGSGVEMVYHIAFSSRSRPFHQLASAAFVQCNQPLHAARLGIGFHCFQSGPLFFFFG